MILTRTTTRQRPQRRGHLTSFFETTPNIWSDAFLAGRGGDFDDDDDGNNSHKDKNNDGDERGQRRRNQQQGQQRPHFLTQQLFVTASNHPLFPSIVKLVHQ